jgi:hypothetical protein
MIHYLHTHSMRFLLCALTLAGVTSVRAQDYCCSEGRAEAAAPSMEFVVVPEEVRALLVSLQDKIGAIEGSEGLWSGLGAGAHIGLKDVVESVVTHALTVVSTEEEHKILADYQQSLQDGSSLITVDDLARSRKHKSFCSVCTNTLNVACNATIGGSLSVGETLNVSNIVTTGSGAGSELTVNNLIVNNNLDTTNLTVSDSLTLGDTPLYEPAHGLIYIQQVSNVTSGGAFITYPTAPTNVGDDSQFLNIIQDSRDLGSNQWALGFQVEQTGTYVVHFWGESNNDGVEWAMGLGINNQPIDLDDAASSVAAQPVSGTIAYGFDIADLKAGDIVRASVFSGTNIVFSRISMIIQRIA